MLYEVITILFPVKQLSPGMTVRVVQGVSRNFFVIPRVIDNDILPVLRDGEAIMSRAILSVFFAGLKNGLRITSYNVCYTKLLRWKKIDRPA